MSAQRIADTGLLLILISVLFWGTSLRNDADVSTRSFSVPENSAYYRLGMEGEIKPLGDQETIDAVPDRKEIGRMLNTRTSPQWRHSSMGVPKASVVCFFKDKEGTQLTQRVTNLHVEHDLPAFSLLVDPEALLSDEKGILVPGWGMVDAEQIIKDRYLRHGKWWQYPGNYHHRGKKWQKRAHLELIHSYSYGEDSLEFSSEVGIRVNGNNTRGFPDKAIRVYSKKPLFGRKRFIFRAAGNDHEDMFMRDAMQHELCKKLGFDVMDAKPVVLYVNGAYWGIKYIRPRIDDKEIARRYDMEPDHVTILEDMVRHYRGNGGQVRKFWQLVDSAESLVGNETALRDYLEHELDLQGFLAYMSAQIILGNRDWPFQNLKYWKYTGPLSDKPYHDGRWRFVMGDSDLAFGFDGAHLASMDMFAHVNGNGGAIARLFKAALKSESIKEQFRSIMLDQLEGDLSASKMLERIAAIENEIAAEMPAHVLRWHRPTSYSDWQKAVEQGRAFARARPEAVRKQLNDFL